MGSFDHSLLLGTFEHLLDARFGLGPGKMGFSSNFQWMGQQVKKLCNCHKILRGTVSTQEPRTGAKGGSLFMIFVLFFPPRQGFFV